MRMPGARRSCGNSRKAKEGRFGADEGRRKDNMGCFMAGSWLRARG
jgi:hypothetical protein